MSLPIPPPGKFSLKDTLNILERMPRTLRALLDDIPETWAFCNEGGSSWSAFDIVGHLIHGERTDWMARLQTILMHGESRSFEPFDRFAQEQESEGKSLAQLLNEFESLRYQNLAMLRKTSLGPQQLGKTGMHPSLGKVTLQNLLATWVVHDLSHVNQITRVLAKNYSEEVGPWKNYITVLSDREQE